MGNQRPVNECIRIGSIFKRRCDGECGSSCVYYQVVGLRGKTLVELREIQTEEYVDSRCVKTEEEQRRFLEEHPGEKCVPTEWDWLVWSRPLPGQFDGAAFTVRALEPSGSDGRNCLQGRGEDSWFYYWEVGENDEGMMTGYDGGYARIALKKEGEIAVMGRSTTAITKTSRLLVVFHLFQYCQEVSFKEITDMLPVSQKTAYRDIRLLRQAGVLQIRYSKQREAFVPVSLEFTQPEWPENQTQKLYLEKIRRLCTLMVQIDGAEDPIAWYRAKYPRLSNRTRQRDFTELGKIGYKIAYNPLHDPDRDWDICYEPGWHYNFPTGAYDLTF